MAEWGTPDYWRSRFGGRGWRTVTVPTPYKDHPEWVETEKRDMLYEQIRAIPVMSQRRRAAMLGMSLHMVQAGIKAGISNGRVALRGYTETGVQILEHAKDWGRAIETVRASVTSMKERLKEFMDGKAHEGPQRPAHPAVARSGVDDALARRAGTVHIAELLVSWGGGGPPPRSHA